MNGLSNPGWADDADRHVAGGAVPPGGVPPVLAAPSTSVSADRIAPSRAEKASVVLTPATGPEQLTAGLRLVFANPGGAPADDNQVGEFIRFAGQRGIQLSELRLLIDRPAAGTERLLWAVLPIYNPGRTVLLLGGTGGAATAAGHAADVRGAIQSFCETAAARGVQLAQVLLDPADQATIDLYEPSGFRRMAELIYLHRAMRRSPPAPTPLHPPLALHNYSQQNHERFAAAILASYVDSCDCPALNGIRRIDDVIAGHQASGEFDPADWFLLTANDEPAGVLLLNRSGQIGGMELVYLGLAPSVRRQGVGQWLMSLALHRVWQQKLSSLTLAVDAGNTAALRLYHRFGMQRVMSKLAMMRDLRGGGALSKGAANSTSPNAGV